MDKNQNKSQKYKLNEWMNEWIKKNFFNWMNEPKPKPNNYIEQNNKTNDNNNENNKNENNENKNNNDYLHLK